MGDGSNRSVVGRRVQDRHGRPDEPGDLHGGQVLGGGRIGGGDDPWSALEEVGARGNGPGPLAPGHWVGAAVATEVPGSTAALLQGAHDRPLDRGDVGHHRGRPPVERTRDDSGGDIRGRGRDDDIGCVERFG